MLIGNRHKSLKSQTPQYLTRQLLSVYVELDGHSSLGGVVRVSAVVSYAVLVGGWVAVAWLPVNLYSKQSDCWSL